MPNPAFVEHCLELLATLGPTRARRMFGGWGLYADDCFVAIVVRDRLYLKTDAATRSVFAAEGCASFVHRDRSGREVELGYWSVPDEAMDSSAAMVPWARLALQAAVAARGRAGAAPKPRRRRSPG